MDLETDLYQAEVNAWQSLARRKFMMFGYWATRWVFIDKVGDFKQLNPFEPLVELASSIISEQLKAVRAKLPRRGGII